MKKRPATLFRWGLILTAAPFLIGCLLFCAPVVLSGGHPGTVTPSFVNALVTCILIANIGLVVLIFAGIKFLISLNFGRRNSNQDNGLISAAAEQAKPAHKLLKGIIRGTGVFMAFFSGVLLVFIFLLMVVGLMHPTVAGPGGWLMGLVIASVAALPVVVLVLAGYRMCRKIGATSVADFAFVISYLWATLFYHLLPQGFPKIIVDPFARSPLVMDPVMAKQGCNGIVAFICFFIFYALLKAQLLRILGLDSVSRPQNPGSSDPDRDVSDPTIPEFPQRSPPYSKSLSS